MVGPPPVPIREPDEPDPDRPAGVGAEFRSIARWTRSLPTEGADLLLGPGHDVAWLNVAGRPLAVSVDTVVEGVHFRRDWSEPEDVGWKALVAALSDLAAVGAGAGHALLALSATAGEIRGGRWLDRMMHGIGQAGEAFSCTIAGGDTTRTDGALTLSVTVFGQVPLGVHLLSRAGAQPGDLLQISGELGWSALGLHHLRRGSRPTDIPGQALRSHLRPRARLDLAAALRDASASIDLSDGLLADAGHLARASAVRLVLDRRLIVSEALVVAAGATLAERCALSGGEDYELLVTAKRLLPGFRPIGEVQLGSPGLCWPDGAPISTPAPGWDHGSPS